MFNEVESNLVQIESTKVIKNSPSYNVRSHIGWGGKQSFLYKGGNLSLARFKNLEGKLKEGNIC